MRAKFGSDRTAGSKILSFKFISRLGVRCRARQFNPLNPPGVGWVPLPQTNMAAVVGRARSCVRGRAWSCVRGRSFVVIHCHSWSCVVVHGRAWSVVRSRARSCVRGRSFVVIRGCARSVVRGRAWSCRSARFAASTAASTAVLPASRPALP